MKIINFKESTHHAQDVHWYCDPSEIGFSVMMLELEPGDLATLRKTGKLYVIAGPGHAIPPPMQITVHNPFKPLPNKKSDEGENSNNAGDDE
jgi:hypothetical protein